MGSQGSVTSTAQMLQSGVEVQGGLCTPLASVVCAVGLHCALPAFIPTAKLLRLSWWPSRFPICPGMYVCRQPLALGGRSALLLGSFSSIMTKIARCPVNTKSTSTPSKPCVPLAPHVHIGPQICPKPFAPQDSRDPSAVKLLGGVLPQKEQLQEWDLPTGRPPISKLFSSLSQTLA